MSDWVKKDWINKEEALEATFNVDAIPVTKNLIDVHQEGNYLVGVSETGVRFRQHIPANKLLNKVDGRYVLQERVIKG